MKIYYKINIVVYYMYNCNYLSKVNIHNKDKQIIFYNKKHIYYIKGSNQKYLSITKLINYFFPEKIVNLKKTLKGGNIKKYYSKKNLQNDYKLQGKRGELLHNNIDRYLNNCDVKTSSKDFEQFLKFLKDNPDLEPYRSEWLIYDNKYKILGIIDAIFRNKRNNKYYIYDWKRVKNIYFQPDFFYNFGNYPLNTIPNLNGYHYSLQLNLYKYIIENNYDIKIDGIYICQFHPFLNNYQIIEAIDLDIFISKILNFIKKENFILNPNKKQIINKYNFEKNHNFNFINIYL